MKGTAPALISVDPAKPVPPYEQVREQIADLITSGTLSAGTRLPPVRQLAADLGLAAGTVARTYSQLEADGLVTTHRGGGTTVAEQAALSKADRAALITARAREYLAAVRRLGASDTEALDAITRCLGEA